MQLQPLTSRRHGFLRLAVALFALLTASVPTGSNLLAQSGRGNSTSRPQVVRLSNQWAVQLAPNADANAIAAQAGFINAGLVSENTYLFIAQDTNAFDAGRTLTLRAFSGVLNAQQQELLPLEPRVLEPRVPTDPLIGAQWHLNNSAQQPGMIAGEDANVLPAWNAGFDGTGVVVASVDDGLWWDNPDLTPNYRADLSFDFFQGDADPRGGAHGTSVGGIMAAADDGVTCGVGAAYNAGLSGIVYASTDAGDAAALQYKVNKIDVYNQSWGPTDDGQTLEAPGPLTDEALQKGITEGRDGNGAIYVWAAGNGKLAGDNINADGWANDRRVIAVGASDFRGVTAYYSEPGAPMLVNAPSSGNSGGNSYGTTTTDDPGAGGYSTGDCTNSFGGTSSAAPLTSGVVALMLQANPNLTWRDVQAVLVASADVNDPTHFDWQTNDAGLLFNHYYGFGRVNAGQAVTTAGSWINLPPELSVQTGVQTLNVPIPTTAAMPLTSVINFPQDLIVEHVEIIVNAQHPFRGDIAINLESPAGTVSRMIEGRDKDNGVNYSNWRMSSVANWGERSAGSWKLSVWDDFAAGDSGTFTDWKLIVHGHSAGGTPQELLVNGGFETELEPDWSLKDPVGDKIKSNKDTKIFAHTGENAFRFKGNEGAVGKIVQKIDAAALINVFAGDTITFSGWYNTSANVGKFGSVKVRYEDANLKTKLELSGTATTEYMSVGMSTSLEAAPTSIKVIMKYEKPSGKLYLDDLSLRIGAVGRSTQALDLPGSDAPANELLPLP